MTEAELKAIRSRFLVAYTDDWNYTCMSKEDVVALLDEIDRLRATLRIIDEFTPIT